VSVGEDDRKNKTESDGRGGGGEDCGPDEGSNIAKQPIRLWNTIE
jgi:hypothetical protein